MQNMEANEEIGTRILEYVLAQYSLSRGLKYMDKKDHMWNKRIETIAQNANLWAIWHTQSDWSQKKEGNCITNVSDRKKRWTYKSTGISWWVKTMRIYRKTKMLSPMATSSNRCIRTTWCGNHRSSWCLLTCWEWWDHSNVHEKKNDWIDGTCCTTYVWKIYKNDKANKKIHKSTESTKWDVKECTTVLQKLRRDLEDEGFKVNLYSPCLANKQINGNKMTVMCHVDNLKVSHHDPWEVTKMAVRLSKLYRDVKVQCEKTRISWNEFRFL